MCGGRGGEGGRGGDGGVQDGGFRNDKKLHAMTEEKTNTAQTISMLRQAFLSYSGVVLETRRSRVQPPPRSATFFR